MLEEEYDRMKYYEELQYLQHKMICFVKNQYYMYHSFDALILDMTNLFNVTSSNIADLISVNEYEINVNKISRYFKVKQLLK